MSRVKEIPLGQTIPMSGPYDRFDPAPPTGRLFEDGHRPVPSWVVLDYTASPLYRYRFAIALVFLLFVVEAIAVYVLRDPQGRQQDLIYFVGIPFVVWLVFLLVFLLLKR